MSSFNNGIFKKPIFFLFEHGKKTKEMFSLPLTPALTIYVGILWVIPIAMISPFRSLYLVSLGLSNTEVGLYSFMFIPFGLVALWLGGYLADVWGRKKTLFLFDVLSWGGYCFCMTFAENKWWGAAALFFIALNLGSGPAYQCLLIEGVSSVKRAVGYSVLQIINLAPGLLFFPLLGGYWKEQRGLSTACHEMFGLFFVCVALGITIRAVFIPHSGAFERVPPTWKHGIKEGLEQYLNTFKNLLRKKAAVPFLASKILDEWVFATWIIYASLYFVQHMGVKDTSLSLFAQVSAYVACGLLFFVVPRLSPQWMVKLLGLDQVFGLAALAVLLIPPVGFLTPFWICLLSVILGAMGSSFYYSVSAAIWMSIIGEQERAKVVAVSTTIFQLGVWILGSLSAFLYGHVSAAALLLFIMSARVIDFFLLRRVVVALQSPGS